MNNLSSSLDCNLEDLEYHPDCDCYLLKNVIKDVSLAQDIAGEVGALQFSQRANDLHCLSQTEDFSIINELPDLTKRFAHLMRTQVRQFVENVFDVKTQNKMTMTGSLYNKGDYLLCHDDLYSDRLIAFVFYLSENWTKSDGGSLHFFDFNEDGPISEKYLNTFVPLFNSLLIFRVSEHSFHEVQEVFGNNPRLSINGWFHGHESLKKPKSKFVKAPFMQFSEYISNDMRTEMIQREYLSINTKQNLKIELRRNLVVLASNFLTDNIYKASVEELQKAKHWQKKGSPMYRKYEALDIHLENNKIVLPEEMPNVKQLVEFLISQYWQIYLNEVTGLEFAVLSEACVPPVCMIEIQKWKEGSYSVMTDDNILRRNPTIEVTAFLEVNEDVIQDETPPYSGSLIRLYGRKFSKKTYKKLGSIKYEKLQSKTTDKRIFKFTNGLNQKSSNEIHPTAKQREKELKKLFTYIERKRIIIQRKLMRIKQYRSDRPQESSVIVPKTNSLLIVMNSHNTGLFTSYIRHSSHPLQAEPKVCIYCINITYLVTSSPDL